MDRHRAGLGRGHRPSSRNPCELHTALLPFTALLPTTAPYVPPAKPGAQQGTESKGLSPGRQPKFTSTQTPSASRAERCSVGRRGEESRDGSEQTPHKAHDMQLENSSKICFPVANPKSTPLVLVLPFLKELFHITAVYFTSGLVYLCTHSAAKSVKCLLSSCVGVSSLPRIFATLQVPCTVIRATGFRLGDMGSLATPSLAQGKHFQPHCPAQPVPTARIYWDSSHTLDMEENTKQVSSSLEKC